MMYMLHFQPQRHEEKRFWSCEERLFVVSALEKQIMVYDGPELDT